MNKIKLKNYIFVFMFLSIYQFLQSQTGPTNPPFIDQYPIISSVTIQPNPNATSGSIFNCKGLATLNITLNDLPVTATSMSIKVDIDIDLLDNSGSLITTVTKSNINLLLKLGTPPYFEYDFDLENAGVTNTQMISAVELNARIRLSDYNVGIAGYNDPNWDWAYYDPVLSSIGSSMYLGSGVNGVLDGLVDHTASPSIYVAVAEIKNVIIPSGTPIIQQLSNFTVNALPTNSAACALVNVTGTFELAQYGPIASTFYHYDIEVYNGPKLVTKVTGIPKKAVSCASCTSGNIINWEANIPMSLVTSYSIRIKNISARIGATTIPPSPYILGASCWTWITPAGRQYGPHSTDHQSSLISIGVKPVPSACMSPMWTSTRYNGMLISGPCAYQFKINNSNNLGSISAPISDLCNTSTIYMNKHVDGTPSCYLYKYKLVLRIYSDASYTESTSSIDATMLNVFNSNVANNKLCGSTVNNAYEVNLIVSGTSSLESRIRAYVNAPSVAPARYFKLQLIGYVDNCPDQPEETLFNEAYLRIAGQDNHNISNVSVNGFGSGSTSVSGVTAQHYVRISADDYNAALRVTLDGQIDNSQVFVRLLNKNSSGQPDLTASGELWNSMTYSPSSCTPPARPIINMLTGSNEHLHFFNFLGGNYVFPAVAGCHSDLLSYIKSQLPTSLYNSDLYLEVNTKNACASGYTSTRYLKIRVLPPFNPNSSNIANVDVRNTLTSGDVNMDITGANNNLTNLISSSITVPYTMGKQTGYLSIVPNPSMRIDGVILIIDKQNGSNWDPVFNPLGYTAHVLNQRNLPTSYDPSSEIRLPINYPYFDYTISDHLDPNANLFASPFGVGSFSSNLVSKDDIFRIKIAAFSFQSTTNNRLSGNKPGGYFTEGYFQCKLNGNTNTKMVSTNTTWTSIPAEGKIDLGRTTDKVTLDFVLPNGGQMEAQVYNLLGQKIGEILPSEYQSGSHHLEIDISQQRSNILIVRSKLNGVVQSVKLGTIN